MKKQIWLAISSLMTITAIHAAPVNPAIQAADNLNWMDSKDLPKGAQVAVLSGDATKPEPFVARIKMPANYHLPIHSHPINEYDTVISGKMYVSFNHVTKVLHPGDFAMLPANVKHSSWTTTDETILQISGVGPWGMIYQKKSG